MPVTDPVLIFAIAITAFLVAPALSRLLRVPSLIGLILLGILLGPNALGVLARDQSIILLGTVGLLYIMFIAGLEVDLFTFKKTMGRSAVFGSLTFFLPQVLGGLVAWVLLDFTPLQAVLLGSIFASHTLLAYPIVRRLGLAKKESVTIAIGGTVIADTAALLVLALVVGAEDGGLTRTFWFQLLGSMAVLTTAVFVGVPVIGRWFFKRVGSDGGAHFTFVLAIVFLVSYAAHVAGLEPIIGAFMAGLALNRLVPENGTLMNRISFVGNEFFIPFFLLSVGMLVDPQMLISDVHTWAVASMMLISVVVTKWLAAMATQRIYGYSSQEAWVIFGLSLPQAAATLAAVIIGYRLEIFDDSVLNGTIVMIIGTCIIGPVVTERFGRKEAIREEQAPYDIGQLPERILIPLANPHAAEGILGLAILMRSPGAEPLFPMSVVREGLDVEERVARAEKMLGQCVVHAAAADVPVQALVRLDVNPADAITRCAREMRSSSIVLGWHGPVTTLERTLGTVFDHVLRHCSQQVMVCRLTRPLNTMRRVFLFVPPFAEREAGFITAIRDTKRLVKQLTCPLVVLKTSLAPADLTRRIKAIKPEVALSSETVGSIEDVPHHMAEGVTAEDLVILLAARQRTVSWNHGLEQLPQRVTDQLPETNTIVIYPALATVALEASTVVSMMSPRSALMKRLVREAGIIIGLTGKNLDQAVDELLQLAVEDDSAAAGMDPTWLRSHLKANPTIIDCGVCLLHCHLPGLDRPQLLLGSSTEGLLGSQPPPISTVLILLSSENIPAEQHLWILAGTTRLVCHAHAGEQLRDARSPQAARDMLLRTIENT